MTKVPDETGCIQKEFLFCGISKVYPLLTL